MCIEILIRLENCRLLENRCAPTVHLFYENINFDFCKAIEFACFYNIMFPSFSATFLLLFLQR